MKKNYPVLIHLIVLLIVSVYWLSCKKTDSSPAPAPVTPAKPVAAFDFTIKNQGALPDTVLFTNNSTNATSYAWTFDDGNSSTLQNPSNIYTAAKTYNIKLVVSGSGGKDSITKTVTITLEKPKADFSFSIQNSGTIPATVLFTNNTLRADSVLWRFDDGSVSKIRNPQNDFKFSRTFNVKLIAYNATGQPAPGNQDIDELLSEINNPVKRWIGDSAHEWGHVSGLPYPDNQLGNVLMQAGNFTYLANCILQQTVRIC